MDDYWFTDNVEDTDLSEDSQCPESYNGESPASLKNTDTDSKLEINKDLENLIDVYESLPQLWNPTNPGYKKKDIRNNALDKLVPIYRKIKYGANRADVRRKINTLRSNYRKELKKILDSRRSGRGTAKVYKPTSWVFYALRFLNKYEKPGNPNIHKLEEVSETDDVQEDIHLEQRQLSSRSIIMSPKPPLQRIKRLANVGSKQNDLLQMACNYLEQSNSRTDNVPTIAIAWGETLTALDPQQRIFAERAIGEVLFEARLGKLDRYSVKINEEPWRVTTPAVMSNSTLKSHQSQSSRQSQ